MPTKLKNREYTNKRGLVKKDHIHKFITKPIIGAGISFGVGIGVTFGGIALYNHANPKDSNNSTVVEDTKAKITELQKEYNSIFVPDKETQTNGINFQLPTINFPVYVKGLPDLPSYADDKDKIQYIIDQTKLLRTAREQALQYNADFNRAKIDSNIDITNAQKNQDLVAAEHKKYEDLLAETTKTKNDLQTKLDDALAADKVDQDEVNRLTAQLKQATTDETQAQNDLAAKQTELDKANADLANAQQKELQDLSNWYNGIVIPSKMDETKGFIFDDPEMVFPSYAIDPNIDDSDLITLKSEIEKAITAKQLAVDWNNEYIHNRDHSIGAISQAWWSDQTHITELKEYQNKIGSDNGMSSDEITSNKNLVDKIAELVLGTSDDTEIPESAYKNLSSPDTMTIPFWFPKITKIGNELFGHSWEADTKIIGGTHVQEIGEYAFENFEITKMDFPELNTIHEGAFSVYAGSSLELLAKDIRIDDGAFEEAKNLNTVNIPHLITLGRNAFNEAQLEHISFPELQSIYPETFQNSLLKSIYLPALINLYDQSNGNYWNTNENGDPSNGGIPIPKGYADPQNSIQGTKKGFFAFPGNDEATEDEYNNWLKLNPFDSSDDPITDPLEFIDQFDLNTESTNEAEKIY